MEKWVRSSESVGGPPPPPPPPPHVVGFGRHRPPHEEILEGLEHVSRQIAELTERLDHAT